MSDYIKQLHAKRSRAWEGAKEILDRAAEEKRDLTAEEDAAYLRANEDINALDERITTMADAQRKAQDAEAAFAELTRTAPTGPASEERKDGNAVLRAWLKGETGQRAFDVRPGGPVNYRATMQKTSTHGVETVPTSFYNRLVEHMIEVSGVLMAGPTVLSTAGGEDLQIPKTAADSSSANLLTAETDTLDQNEPTFGQVTLGSYKYGFLMKISHELINDTGVDLEGYLSRQAGRALGNGFGVHLVSGTGSGQPNGVLTAASSGVAGAVAVNGVPTADNLIDLQYSVIAPYRNSTSCGWLMKDSTVAAVRKLKDSNNVYVWQPGLLAGSPDTLLGKPVYTDPNMPAVATSAKSILFGDFSQYFVRQVETLRFERSDDFAFDTDVVTYRAILRGDGDLVDTTGAIKYFAGGAAS